ncbi:MAG: tRNA (adenosine(37)-N6)-dimethylallyltransferase MiaA [Bacteroidota bacterium]|nr:tRNA (adenosine(37)-N6)-dimethylallyltransferase MiaA [Bacteroidota bacterium]
MLSISGPTAVGKTRCSLQIAEHFKTEIISCDSRQIYKEMKIGTAVPEYTELQRIKHHFIGKLSIHDYYNVSMFEQDIVNLSSRLFESHNLLLMVGGSGMYLNAVLYGIDDIPDPDMKIREHLIQQHESKGLSPLLTQLEKLDPVSYQRIDRNNPKRVIRAIEVCLSSGKPFSSFHTRQIKSRDFDILMIGLEIPRETLYERIDKRIDIMLEQGLENEARQLHPHQGLIALKSIGYREFFQYFDGKVSKDEAIHLIRKNTRQYARKQINWLKRYKAMQWFHPDDVDGMIKRIETYP